MSGQQLALWRDPEAEPFPDPTATVLSLGVGVQSSTLLLMAEVGSIPRPDFAVFADTGWEPAVVYAYLEYLRRFAPMIPIVVASRGNLRDDVVAAARGLAPRVATPPLFTLARQPDARGKLKRGILRRQCTRDYKVAVINRAIRRRVGPARQRVNVLVGFSTDEQQRVFRSRVGWIRTTFPLLDLGMDRQACLEWCDAHGFARPPKSACVGCPYRSDAGWIQMRDHAPDEWADAVAYDRALREGQLPHVRDLVFLHSARVPLDQVALMPGRRACKHYC